MHITLTPQRRDARLRLERHGDTLTINGERFDLSAIPDGAVLPRDAVACAWLALDIERKDGALHLTIIVPHGPAAPHETLFPATLHLTGDGPITLPPIRRCEMSNIDMSRLVSADTRIAAAAELRAQKIKAEYRMRIFEVADQIDQTNLAAAYTAGRMKKMTFAATMSCWTGSRRCARHVAA